MKIIKYNNRIATVNDKGELHSFDNNPAFEYTNGDKLWYKEGKLHRLDGPAIEYSNGFKLWFKEGKRHRDDGPACEYEIGNVNWYYEDKEIKCKSTEEFQKIIKLKAFW